VRELWSVSLAWTAELRSPFFSVLKTEHLFINVVSDLSLKLFSQNKSN
jgi:hypothetical protein